MPLKLQSPFTSPSSPCCPRASPQPGPSRCSQSLDPLGWSPGSHTNTHPWVLPQPSPYLVPPDAVVGLELLAVLQPAQRGVGRPARRALELHRLGGGDGVELLLHLLRIGPVGSYGLWGARAGGSVRWAQGTRQTAGVWAWGVPMFAHGSKWGWPGQDGDRVQGVCPARLQQQPPHHNPRAPRGPPLSPR